MLYFFNDSCAPCKVLRIKVQQMIEQDFPKITLKLINGEFFPETLVQFDVFSTPTLLVFFESKEFIREGKNVSVTELHDKIRRIYQLFFP